MKNRNKIMRFFGLHPQNDVRRKFAFTLAEGATHVGNSNNKRKFAFTLAEVLVTLGIIGVVAVLTVPNIISSYQKKVYVAQLQKAYNQLQQVFDLAMVEDEVEYLADTELFQSINGDNLAQNEDQSAFFSKLGEYMKIQKICPRLDFSDGCHDIYYIDLSGNNYINEDSDYSHIGSNRGGKFQIFTKDGMIYYLGFSKIPYIINVDISHGDITCDKILADGGNACSFFVQCFDGGGIEVDVNGKKGPNKYGRDMFRFGLDDKGQLYLGGTESFWGKNFSYFKDDTNSCDTGSAYGVGCAAKIMDDGWVMDY